MGQKVTEEEAKGKWCRHGFVAVHWMDHRGACAASANRTDRSGFPMMSRCLGSDCMDWEWASAPEDKEERVGFCDADGKL